MGCFYIHLLLKMHYLLILLTAPYCHWYQNYLPFHSLESVKETKKENSTNQFALIESISLYTLYTVKKKKEMTLSYIKNLSMTWHKRISILQISNVLICGNLFLLW